MVSPNGTASTSRPAARGDTDAPSEAQRDDTPCDDALMKEAFVPQGKLDSNLPSRTRKRTRNQRKQMKESLDTGTAGVAAACGDQARVDAQGGVPSAQLRGELHAFGRLPSLRERQWIRMHRPYWVHLPLDQQFTCLGFEDILGEEPQRVDAAFAGELQG